MAVANRAVCFLQGPSQKSKAGLGLVADHLLYGDRDRQADAAIGLS